MKMKKIKSQLPKRRAARAVLLEVLVEISRSASNSEIKYYKIIVIYDSILIMISLQSQRCPVWMVPLKADFRFPHLSFYCCKKIALLLSLRLYCD